MTSTTKEAQNQNQIDEFRHRGPCTMGPWTSSIWRHDPRHLLFMLARYKFASKLLAGRSRVLEVGCGDAFGTPVVLQTVGAVHGVDFEPLVLEDVRLRYSREGIPCATFEVHNMLDGPLSNVFDGAYSLDVIEHIQPDQERCFIDNICSSLSSEGMLIIGTPNITSREYASEGSLVGHVNLKSAETIRTMLARRFRTVLVFSMNDEIVHTGFYPMAHYILGVGIMLTN